MARSALHEKRTRLLAPMSIRTYQPTFFRNLMWFVVVILTVGVTLVGVFYFLK